MGQHSDGSEAGTRRAWAVVCGIAGRHRRAGEPPRLLADESASDRETASGDATGAWYASDGLATRSRRAGAYLLLAFVMVSVAAMSWSGLFAFATDEMHWSHAHSLLVPVSLDVAAITAALLALDRIEKGETGAAFRVIAAFLVGLSAFINWRRALLTGNIAEEVFFPAMSVIAYGLVHAVMGSTRRDVKRAQHGHKSKARIEPLPRYGLLVWVPWLGAPGDALESLQAAVRKRLTATARSRTAGPSSRAAASATASGQPGTGENRSSDGASEAASEAASATASGHGSQSDRIRIAIAALRESTGSEPSASDVREYMGGSVPIGRVNDVMRRDRLRLVDREEETA